MQFADTEVVWPEIAEIAAPFYAGMQAHKVMIQCCDSCATYLPPAQLVCDHCGSQALKWLEVDGAGEIYSFVVYHRSFHPSFDNKLPYTVALVELSEGPRLQVPFLGIEGECKVGLSVKPVFTKISDQHTLLCYEKMEK